MKGGDEMRDGHELRLIGSGGAPFLATVGRPFSAEEIERRLKSGEWRRAEGNPAAGAELPEDPAAPANGPAPEPQPPVEPAPAVDPERPADTAAKSDWVAYIARTQHMSREDAANYTKADLIAMAD